MSNIKRIKKRNFTAIDNVLVKDNRMSWKARGIFLYLWSMPDDWNFYVDEVAKHSVDGVKSLKKGLSELEKYGYLKREMKRNESGHFSNMAWELSDTGIFTVSTKTGPTEKAVNAQTGPTENGRLLIKNNTNKKETLNKEDTKEILSSSHSTVSHSADYKTIVDYLNQKAGTNYRSTSKKTQRLINARFNDDDATIDDFKKVIDIKVSQWKNDDKMSKYLRPETLFGTKFESYLNERPKGKADSKSIDGIDWKVDW